MKIRFTIDFDDLMAFNRHIIRTAPQFRKVRRNLTISLSVIFLLLAIIVPRFPLVGVDVFIFVYFLAAAAVFAFITGPIITRNLTRKTAKELRKPEKAIYYGQRGMEFDDEGITIIAPDVEERLKWKTILKVDEIPGPYYLLYISDTSAHMIPKMKLGRDEIDTLESILKRNVSSVPLNIKTKNI